MKLSRWFACLLFTLSCFCYSQNLTNLTGTVTDSDSQAWLNATWTATIVVPGGGVAHFLSGGVVPSQFYGALDGTGTFPITTPTVGNTAQIIPAGVVWNYCFTSVTSAPPICFQQATKGGAFNLGAYLSAFLPGPRIEAKPSNYAYNSTEIINPSNGTGYTKTSVTPPVSYLWQGTGPSNGSYIQVGSGGGGGGTFPATTKLIGGTATANTGQVGTPGQMGVTLSDVTNGNQLETDANPTIVGCSGGCNDELMGIGVTPSIVTGAGLGGQFDTVYGWNAGALLTTARENTLIGERAGAAITGNSSPAGSSAEDCIVTAIGSEAAGAMTCGGFGSNNALDIIAIGQKAVLSATTAASLVAIGNHAGDNITSYNHSTLMGDFVYTGTNPFTSLRDTIIGALQKNEAFPTGYQSTDNTCVGFGCLGGLGAGATGGTEATSDTTLGSISGAGVTSGYNSEFIGAYSMGGGPFTGSYDTCLGYQTCFYLTSATRDFIWENQSVTSGSNDIVMSLTANASTASNQVIIGQGSGQENVGTENNQVLIGNFANAADVGGAGHSAGAIAIGDNSNASDTASTFGGGIAEGTNSIASNDGSVAIGYSAQTAGYLSASLAYGAQAQASQSVAVGEQANVNAAAANASAFGEQAVVGSSGTGATEIGPGTCNTNNVMCFQGKLFVDNGGNLYSAAIGANPSPLCTTTNGELTVSGCSITALASQSVSLTPTSGITATCISGSCTSLGGTYQLVSTTFTTGTALTITWGSAVVGNFKCTVNEHFTGGITANHAIGWTTITTTSLSIGVGVTIAASTADFDYACSAN
jgi:hypothetical protein